MKSLIDIIKQLRGKGGCPWDRKQNLKSLRHCLLEETHEVLEAIDLEDSEKVNEELGDLLAVVAAMLVIGEESRSYDKKTVIKTVREKLVRRHPHVFRGEKAKDALEAHGFWDREKSKEKKSEKSLLQPMGRDYPALLEAYKIGKKVSRVGFDWQGPGEVMKKIDEEIKEMKHELRGGKKAKVKEELGDFLFTAAHLARHLKIDPEVALLAANRKFRKRFQIMEKLARSSRHNLDKMKPAELEKLWKQAKRRTR